MHEQALHVTEQRSLLRAGKTANVIAVTMG